jgi:dihydrofolate reductase
MGRLTYEVASTRLAFLHSMGKKIVVVSTTLEPAREPRITIVRDNLLRNIAAMKAESGKDIWLMGGGAVFRGLIDAGLVDGIQVTLIPVLLGGGVPLIPAGKRHTLQLTESHIMSNGSVVLHYAISRKPPGS